MLKLIPSRDQAAIDALLNRSGRELEAAEKVVAPIVADVRRRGDRAIDAWTARLDGRRLAFEGVKPSPGRTPLCVPAEEMAAAWRAISPGLRRALRHAARNIEAMARRQMPGAWTMASEPGVSVGQVVRPLESVGCYVPAGRHPLPSTVLMTAIPARVAGVRRIVVACPNPSLEVLAAAHFAGAATVYRMGGAQAVAALAYGTKTVARVQKIVGPGNLYVTAAKKLVWADCGIDFLAGPTEVLLVAEAGANAEFVAADMIAQAEHDPRATAWLLTPSRALARRVDAALRRQLQAAPNPVAQQSLEARGAAILTRDLAEAARLANRLAPEHITIPPALLGSIENAGSIFVGDYAPQAVGDYLSGANHVLPTAALASLRGGLAVTDFLKVITVQRLTRPGLARLAPSITALARAEGLEGHARSVEIRLGGRSAALSVRGSRRRARRTKQ